MKCYKKPKNSGKPSRTTVVTQGPSKADYENMAADNHNRIEERITAIMRLDMKASRLVLEGVANDPKAPAAVCGAAAARLGPNFKSRLLRTFSLY